MPACSSKPLPGLAGIGGDAWWDEHRNGGIDRDFFAMCFTQLAGTYSAALSPEQMQVFLDLFRADGWSNRHFKEACNWLVRHNTRMPAYADFMRWKRGYEGCEEGF